MLSSGSISFSLLFSHHTPGPPNNIDRGISGPKATGEKKKLEKIKTPTTEITAAAT